MEEIIPNNYKGFGIESKNKKDIECSAIISTCINNKIPFKIVKNIKEFESDFIPVGSIEFVENIFGKHLKPDYYPEYLKRYLKREIWYTDKWPLGRKVFIKPSDRYKRFSGFITNGGYRGKKRPPYTCSEIINIIDEWRYYICKGEVIFSNWYKGVDDIEKECPKLDIAFKSDLCCCLDMGKREDGELVLIEEQHPFSCGWYGKQTIENNLKYTKWIGYGWEYMNKDYKG